jgi:hypothetical protein
MARTDAARSIVNDGTWWGVTRTKGQVPYAHRLRGDPDPKTGLVIAKCEARGRRVELPVGSLVNPCAKCLVR